MLRCICRMSESGVEKVLSELNTYEIGGAGRRQPAAVKRSGRTRGAHPSLMTALCRLRHLSCELSNFFLWWSMPGVMHYVTNRADQALHVPFHTEGSIPVLREQCSPGPCRDAP